MAADQAYYKETVTAFRSILNSMKGPGELQPLLKDYRSIYGTNIDYHKLGHSSLKEFFSTCSSFRTEQRGSSLLIYARPLENSAHITKMVARQKVSKNMKARSKVSINYYTNRPRPMPLMSLNPFTFSPNFNFAQNYKGANIGYASINNPGNYSGFTRNVPTVIRTSNSSTTYENKSTNQTVKSNGFATNQTKNNSTNNTTVIRTAAVVNGKNTIASNTTKSSSNVKAPITAPSNNNNNNNSKTPNNNIVKKNIENSNTVVNGNITKSSSKEHQAPIRTTSIEKTNNNQNQVERDVDNKTQSAQIKTSDLREKLNQKKEVKKSSETVPVIPPAAAKPAKPAKSSISDRLIIRKPNVDLDLSPTPPTAATKTTVRTAHVTPPTTPSTWDWNMEKFNDIEKLKIYAKQHGMMPPQFKCFKLVTKRFQSRVVLNDIIYSTYPTDFSSEEEANIAVAKLAIESLKKVDNFKKYPTFDGPDYELANKLFELLGTYQYGLFRVAIPEMFQKVYLFSLPEYWFEIIMSSPNLFVMDKNMSPDDKQFIIYANKAVVDLESSSAPSDEAEAVEMDVLKLPWEKKHWDLCIRHVVSTNEIWANIIGEDYSKKFESLTTDIEMAMLNDKNVPESIYVGDMYLISVSDCWYRARVVDKNIDNNTCLCFFIDFGDTEWYKNTEIFTCDKKYLKFPGQGVRFALEGFEDFEVKADSNNYLMEYLANKRLVAEILSTSEEYDDYENSDELAESRIRARFFDTSTDDDINLNVVLCKKAFDDLPQSTLNRTTVNPAIITCIRDDGNIFCQLQANKILNYITKRIQALAKNNDLKLKIQENLKNNNGSIRKGEIYLVYDVKDKNWYRAVLEEGASDICKMFYIDFGFQRSISVLNICGLKDLDLALSNLPPQAIKMRLHKIPDTTESIIQRLRGLLPYNTPALIQVAVAAPIPSVFIFVYVGPKDILSSINESIRLENEIERMSVETNTDLRVKVESLLQTTASISLNGKNTSDLPTLADYPLENSEPYFDVRVSIASNPHNFIVQPYNSVDTKNFNEIMIEIKKLYEEGSLAEVRFDDIKIGQACIGKIPNDDEFVYRVIIENICDPSLIHVYVCDIGEHVILNVDHLKVLPEKFISLPKQAIRGRLCGIKPIHGDWTPDDVLRFQSISVCKDFVSKIIKKNSNGSYDMNLIDTSGPDDIEIKNILIEEGRAVLDI